MTTLRTSRVYDDRTGRPLPWYRMTAATTRELDIAAATLGVGWGQRFLDNDPPRLLLTPDQHARALDELGAIRMESHRADRPGLDRAALVQVVVAVLLGVVVVTVALALLPSSLVGVLAALALGMAGAGSGVYLTRGL